MVKKRYARKKRSYKKRFYRRKRSYKRQSYDGQTMAKIHVTDNILFYTAYTHGDYTVNWCGNGIVASN